jgi:hypothetical protein
MGKMLLDRPINGGLKSPDSAFISPQHLPPRISTQRELLLSQLPLLRLTLALDHEAAPKHNLIRCTPPRNISLGA